MNKIQIKLLLREGMKFFDTEKTSFLQVIKCVEDLLINFNESINNKYKVDFFKDELKKALNDYRATNNKSNEKAITELQNKYDNDLLNQLGIIDLLNKLNNVKNTEKIVSDYLNSIDKLIESTYKLYKVKFNKDNKYNVLSKIENNNVITFKKFIKDIYLLQIELLKMQEWVIANDKKILILFEGRDAAGKGSNIDFFTENLIPKKFRVESFGIPTDEDKKNWFKRYKKVLPKKGEIVLFDRSWYNRAVIEPAMGYCTPDEYKDFMNSVGDFEQDLINDKDIMLFKVWLDVSKDKQELRFELRKHNPLKYWKFSKNDEKMIKNWDKLTPYINKMLDKTNFNFSKWIEIDSDDKFNSILNTMKTILSTINYTNKDLKIDGDKIIFLDFHGVIISLEHENHDCNKGWDKEAIKNLNNVTDETGAKIVVISACKNDIPFKETKKHLINAGVTGEIIGKTIDIDKSLRAEQVNHWRNNNKVSNFVIIDDKPYDSQINFKNNFIKVNPEKLFTKLDADNAIETLK